MEHGNVSNWLTYAKVYRCSLNCSFNFSVSLKNFRRNVGKKVPGRKPAGPSARFLPADFSEVPSRQPHNDSWADIKNSEVFKLLANSHLGNPQFVITLQLKFWIS